MKIDKKEWLFSYSDWGEKFKHWIHTKLKSKKKQIDDIFSKEMEVIRIWTWMNFTSDWATFEELPEEYK